VSPNFSLHAYTSEDGKKKKLFSRFHMIRWTVPVDDQNSKMIGWRVMGPGIDTRGVGDKNMVGYETIDFLEGQVAMRRPERFGKYELKDMPPIPSDHRARANYKDCQYAPGDYEAIISQRPIAVHALENPTKFDAGLYMFRKLLRDAVRGANPNAALNSSLSGCAIAMANPTVIAQAMCLTCPWVEPQRKKSPCAAIWRSKWWSSSQRLKSSKVRNALISSKPKWKLCNKMCWPSVTHEFCCRH
jgi:hypothetical protein